MTEQTFDIKSAAEHLGLSQVYVRRAIHKGKLATNGLVPIAEGSNIRAHEITQAQLDEWRGSTASRTTREDGKSKFLLYATNESFNELTKVVEKAGIDVIMIRASDYRKMLKSRKQES